MEVLAIAVSQEKQIRRHKNGTEKPVFLDVFFGRVGASTKTIVFLAELDGVC